MELSYREHLHSGRGKNNFLEWRTKKDMSSNKTLGAYYQVYNNKKATDFVLENFRKHFPDSPVLLISDGGEDFTDLAEKYNTQFVKLHNIFVKDGDAYYDAERMEEGWRRHRLAVENAGTDYVMILEDDVLVQSHVDFGDFSFKGVTVNRIPPVGMKFITENNGNAQGSYGACGGSVYSCKDFLEVYDEAISFTKQYHNEIFFVEPNRDLAAIDCNLVFHFNRVGFNYEKAEWLAEYTRNHNWSNYPVVHQYKLHY